MRLQRTLMLMTLSLATACAEEQQEDTYEQELLHEMRAALPQAGRLQAATPSNSANAPGDARYPGQAYDIVVGINGHVHAIVETLRFVSELPPTLFNSDTEEFVWGPWENEDGIGYVTAYIRRNPPKDNGEAPDFEFGYALLVGIDNDLAHMLPVIYGGGTPDPDNEDNGVGVTVWDIEAHHAFIQEHRDEALAAGMDVDGPQTRGRFVALYGAGDGDNPGDRFAFVYAVLRNFVDAESPNYAAELASGGGDLEYLYGRFESTGDFSASFLDLDVSANQDGNPDTEEAGRMHLAFVNDGRGRAEVQWAGFDESAQHVSVESTECWSDSIETTYLLTQEVSGTPVVVEEVGTVADCLFPFNQELGELDLPTLDTFDAERDNQTRRDIKCVGEYGLDAETQDCTAIE